MNLNAERGRATLYYGGRPGPPGPVGPPGVGGASVSTVDFTCQALVGTIPVKVFDNKDYVISNVSVVIWTPFDSDTSFSVGIAAENYKFIHVKKEETSLPDDYQSFHNSRIKNSTVILYPYYISLPTSGSGTVFIYYSEEQ